MQGRKAPPNAGVSGGQCQPGSNSISPPDRHAVGGMKALESLGGKSSVAVLGGERSFKCWPGATWIGGGASKPLLLVVAESWGRHRGERPGSRRRGTQLTASPRPQHGAPRYRCPRAAPGRTGRPEPRAAEALPPQTAGRAGGRSQHPVGAAGARGQLGPRGAAGPLLRAGTRAGRGPENPEEGGRARRGCAAQAASAAE